MVDERTAARFSGKRVHIVGLGRFGGQVALARYLRVHGARLVISDTRDEPDLAPSISALGGLENIELALGDSLPAADSAQFDFIAPSPAVPPGNAHLKSATEAGVETVTEIGLFIERCPAAITAVTGSAGKSTITALTAAMHEASGQRVHFGGNIGRSLLEELDGIDPDDILVLELSSFQLDRLPDGFPPFRVAVLACLFEHHLDWHGSYEAYVRAKQRIFLGQVEGRDLTLRDAIPVASSATRLRGLIMRRNCALAATAARFRSATEAGIDAAMAAFPGLPHRFEEVARLETERGSVVFVNASKATCPRTAAAALAVADPPIFAILGGAAFPPGAEEEVDPMLWAVSQSQAQALIGPATALLAPALPEAEHAADLEDAVERMGAAALAAGSGTVILAPGFPSYDAFVNYEERGEVFRRAARELVKT